MNIDLSRPLDLPDEFVDRLRGIESICNRQEFLESLIKNKNISALVCDIDEYCRKNRIIGVHYTRSIPESIRLKGLLIRNGAEIREALLSEYGYLFSQEEISTMKERWSRYYDSRQNSSRNGRICFNFTEKELGRSGTTNLLGLYGGEQVSKCFELNEPIGRKLRTIGKPMVVRCSLDPNQVKTSLENPWGKILLSSFHALVNPEAYRTDQDGRQSVPVKPEDIVEIRVLTHNSLFCGENTPASC